MSDRFEDSHNSAVINRIEGLSLCATGCFGPYGFLINKNQQKDSDNTTFNVIYISLIDILD